MDTSVEPSTSTSDIMENRHRRDSSSAEPDNEPPATWDQENVNKLIQRVMIISKANKMDDTPFTKHTIDWKEVSFGDFTAQACSVKWEKMLMSVRQYRTLYDVAIDMFGHVDKKSTKTVMKWNRELGGTVDGVAKTPRKATKSLNTNLPKKPKVNAYCLFSTEMLSNISSSMHGKERMIEVGRLWANLSMDEKQIYKDRVEKEKQEYVRKLKEYSSKHPDDGEVKEMIEGAEGKRSRDRSKESRRKSADKKITDFLHKGSSQRQSPRKKMKQEHELDTTDEGIKEEDAEMDTSATAEPESPKKSPKKKRNRTRSEDEDTDEPKVKTHRQQLTGEMAYLEHKRESFTLEHPDYDEEEVEAKLKRKYKKLSEKRKARYEQLAEEMNN